MKLGAFSVSLAVKDLTVSKQFYESLGFQVFAGDPSMKYLIMQNGTTLIGLFEGMFENNILTFNPGWDHDANPLAEFEDVRSIQKHLQEQGYDTGKEIEGDGPGSFMITDPDGNTILFDQHR